MEKIPLEYFNQLVNSGHTVPRDKDTGTLIWQREQGIDWIPLGYGLAPEIGQEVLLLLEGETFLKGALKFNAAGETIWVAYFKDGEYETAHRDVTHYALINLPKTDNS